MHKIFLLRLLLPAILSLSLTGLIACGGDSQVAEENSAATEGLASCPDPIIIQTDWFPESEYGATYELFGDGTYLIDNENRSVTGTLHDGEVNTGIGLEVRTGGPAIGFTPVASHMYTDTSITLGYANTEGQIIRFNSAPLLSVVAPLEKNPQMIMWDPDTYPDVESIEDLGKSKITISVFGPEVFSEVFIAQGIWSADQVDPSYDGSPANFIANQGSIAQQGFASAEPYNYKNTYEEWGKDVEYQLLHDAGFPVYSQTLAIRSNDKVSLDACLRDLVPIIQRAVVSFSSNPDNTNALIVDVVESFNSFWVYGEEIANYSVNTQSELGLVGNGTNETVGDMDKNRIQKVIDLMDEAGINTNEIGPSDIFTNDYIDESIGFN
ncbi:MAG: nitrate ABC transporter substrate-binding protein [Actinobacteria bacterium]|nr:nitrate ABC transporter substrate-binding protein [Actinomycetota bacterium]|tara:strand:+ start:86 stop:1228 length:1143 start_codon:yes stop_codon:yes gene_type:complete